MILIFDHKTGKGTLYTDIKAAAEHVNKDRSTLSKTLSKAGECFINQYFIQVIIPIKSRRGKK